MVSSGIYIHVSRYIVQLLFLFYFTFAAIYWLSYCRWGFILSHCCWSFPVRLFPLPQWSRWTLVQSLSSVALWPCAYCTELIESSIMVTFLSCWIGFSWSYCLVLLTFLWTCQFSPQLPSSTFHCNSNLLVWSFFQRPLVPCSPRPQLQSRVVYFKTSCKGGVMRVPSVICAGSLSPSSYLTEEECKLFSPCVSVLMLTGFAGLKAVNVT